MNAKIKNFSITQKMLVAEGLPNNYVFTASWDYVLFNRTNTRYATLVFDPANQLLINGTFDYHDVSLDNPTNNYRTISFKLVTVVAGVVNSSAEKSIM